MITTVKVSPMVTNSAGRKFPLRNFLVTIDHPSIPIRPGWKFTDQTQLLDDLQDFIADNHLDVVERMDTIVGLIIKYIDALIVQSPQQQLKRKDQ